MEQTALLRIILQNADAIKNEYGSRQLQASHIAAAVADLCKAFRAYGNFTVGVGESYPPARVMTGED